MANRFEVKGGFADMAHAARRRRPNFLDAIDQIIDWRPVEQQLKQFLQRSKAGPTPYPALCMFKSLLLQSWYNLSDPQTEDALADRASFSKFAGFSLDHDVPDETTICRFRNNVAPVLCNLFALINSQLTTQGFIVKEGAIIDASIVSSSRRPRKSEEVIVGGDREEELNSIDIKYSEDVDARWTVKSGKAYYGYKVTLVTDSGHNFILSCDNMAANEADISRFTSQVEAACLPADVTVYADKGYCSASNRHFLSEHNLFDGILHKARRNHPLSEVQRQSNRILSRMRSKIEGVFGTLKQDYGLHRMRYLGLAKGKTELLLKSISFNLKKACLMVMRKPLWI
jgi:IS5 family transposase